MAIRAYILYTASAAAAALAQVQILKRCELLCVNFSMYATVGNGEAIEVSQVPARQWGTNNTTGILATAICSNAATGPSQLANNHFVPLPPGCVLEIGSQVFLHGTQLGAGGTITVTVTLYVKE